MSNTHYFDIRACNIVEPIKAFLPNGRKKNLEAFAKSIHAFLRYGDKITGEHIFPGYSRIALDVGASYKSIQRHAKLAVELGILVVVKSRNWMAGLPYEYALSRRFAALMLKTALDKAKGMIALKLKNSIDLLKKAPVQAAKSLAWRKANRQTTPKPTAPDVAGSPASPAFIGSDRLTGQNDHLPPSQRSGEWRRDESDGSAAASHPVFPWAQLLHAHAKTVKPPPLATI